MRKSLFTEAQTIGNLKQAEAEGSARAKGMNQVSRESRCCALSQPRLLPTLEIIIKWPDGCCRGFFVDIVWIAACGYGVLFNSIDSSTD